MQGAPAAPGVAAPAVAAPGVAGPAVATPAVAAPGFAAPAVAAPAVAAPAVAAPERPLIQLVDVGTPERTCMMHGGGLIFNCLREIGWKYASGK